MNALLLSLALTMNGPVGTNNVAFRIDAAHKKEPHVHMTTLISVALASMVGATVGSLIGSHIFHS